jgi:serine/threonine protein kinase
MRGDCEEEAYVKSKGKRLRWPAAAKSQQSVKNVREMLLLEEILQTDYGPQHVQLRELLMYMLKIDPNERPSASECLKHPFFSLRNFSKSTEKT